MLRLLIIDDESAIRSGISAYFPWASLGIEVAATCQDGMEALAILEQTKPDLILCDIRMPRMDGISFVEKVRERGCPCDIVFISAHKDFEYAKKAIELGVREYIVKAAGAGLAGAPSASTAPGPSLADRALRLFEEDLVNVSLSSIAEKLAMSPNYLSARLHQETGRTFSDLLCEARMRRAKMLLANPSSRVGRISAMVGYASAKSFIRAFRLHYGSSPTAYRFAAQNGRQASKKP